MTEPRAKRDVSILDKAAVVVQRVGAMESFLPKAAMYMMPVGRLLLSRDKQRNHLEVSSAFVNTFSLLKSRRNEYPALTLPLLSSLPFDAPQADRRLTTHVSPLYQADCPTEEVDGANASILRSALTVGLVILFTQPFSARYIAKQVE